MTSEDTVDRWEGGCASQDTWWLVVASVRPNMATPRQRDSDVDGTPLGRPDSEYLRCERTGPLSLAGGTESNRVRAISERRCLQVHALPAMRQSAERALDVK